MSMLLHEDWFFLLQDASFMKRRVSHTHTKKRTQCLQWGGKNMT